MSRVPGACLRMIACAGHTAEITTRRLWLVALTILGVMALPAAAAQADATWSGLSTTSTNWSDPANWSGGVAPTSPAGALTFPNPGSGSCASPAACYTSNNDLLNLTMSSLGLSNTSGQYQILGNSFTVGSGGIAFQSAGGGQASIWAPIVLSGGPQMWVVQSTAPTPAGGYNILGVHGGVTGTSAEALTLSVSNGDLFIDGDMEVGPVTKIGSGTVHIGGPPGSNQPGSVNATNGGQVAINGGTVIANPGATTGQLAISNSTLLLQTNTSLNGATTLQVNGPATLGSSATTSTFINDNGSMAGTDFSQLSATGNISLGGRLVLGQDPINGHCVPLNPGDVATLVTTSGTRSGTFTNAPDGAILTMSPCQSTAPQVQIHYTSNSVTATVLGTTTTTLGTPNPSPAGTNQTVTLTATVTTSSGVAPAGTVAFSANGSPISGCTSQPVTGSGSSGTAICSTSFAAAGSPESLTGTFTGSPSSSQQGSTSSAQILTIDKGTTTTTLSASTKSLTAGNNVTYTATVTPGVSGPSKPSGSVQFLDGGSPVTGCAAQPLTAGPTAATATCTSSYPSAGSHAISVAYGGDTNFTGSSAPPTTVTVTAPPKPPVTPPAKPPATPPPASTGTPPPAADTTAPAASATTSPATHLGTTQATLNGSVSTGGAAATWKFEYGATTAYGRATAAQTVAAGQQAAVPVSAVVNGLSPNVLYHYRLVVSTTAGPTYGKGMTFTTNATGRLAGPGGLLMVLGRTILVPETCQSGVLCRGRLSFTFTLPARAGRHAKPATVLCASASFRIRAHHSTRVRTRLLGGCLRRLRAQPHHRLVVTYLSRSQTGQVGQRRRITFVLR